MPDTILSAENTYSKPKTIIALKELLSSWEKTTKEADRAMGEREGMSFDRESLECGRLQHKRVGRGGFECSG